jgi:hypothetical protein
MAERGVESPSCPDHAGTLSPNEKASSFFTISKPNPSFFYHPHASYWFIYFFLPSVLIK